MKLYLSSYHFGSSPERLLQLVGSNKTAAIIMNASDNYGDSQRPKYFTSFSSGLASLGISSTEIDLREFFGKPQLLSERISEVGMLWVSGGNTFVLRRAMKESGLDLLLPELLRSNEIVYGGFSAGACVLSPSLRGIHLADDPVEVPQGYPAGAIWEGVNIVDFYIVPHFRSPHPESAAMEGVVEYLKQANKRYYTLRDGEALLMDGDQVEVVG
jgi:dipeptidase E